MGTYGYISIIAMLCYGFLLLMFLTAKKNKIINSFLVVLLGLLAAGIVKMDLRKE